MFIAWAVGPTLEELRPLKPPVVAQGSTGGQFPLYPELEPLLLAHDPGGDGQADPTVAHLLAVAATYAYAEVVGLGGTPDTLARMMARLGMPANRTLMVAERIDAAFVVASGFVVQSADGRVVLLCYRGTEPFNVANWMTDADLHNAPVNIRVGGREFPVHPGFYRNVRAVRSPLIEALDRARQGLSIIDGSPLPNPMEALHLAGHSLGAAMAGLQALLLLNDPAYEGIAVSLRSVYQYGAPMFGGRPLAGQLTDDGTANRFQRFVYRNDTVPPLPPIGLGDYAHFGPEYRVARGGGYERAARPTGQATFFAIPIAATQFVTERLPIVRRLPFPFSIDDHLPVNYINWLSPPGLGSEYGDYPARL
jgi:hypothetical protein